MKQIKFLSVVSVLWTLLFFSSCVKESVDGGNVVEGKGAIVKLTLKSPETTKTRSALSPEDEKAIETVDVLIFDKNGAIVTNSRYHYNAQGITVTTYSGNDRKIYVIANVLEHTDVSYSKDVEKITTLSELQDLVVTMSGVLLLGREKLMSVGLRENVTIQPGSNTLSGDPIKLDYVSSRIDFTIKDETPNGDYFTALAWDVVDIPIKSYVLDKGIDASDPSAASNFHTTAGAFSFDVDDVNKTWSSSFYSLENRRGGRVDRVAPGTGGSKDDKNDQNKAWYAPTRASHIAIDGLYYSKDGTSRAMTMNIYLGQDNHSDYNVQRGVNQIITITVKGVNNILVDTNIDYKETSFDVETSSSLAMDAHPDMKVFRIQGKAYDGSTPSVAKVEILDNSGNAAGEVGFTEADVSWLKLSPLNLYRHQVKQSGADGSWQQSGTQGQMVRPKYIPHKSVRTVGYIPPAGVTLGTAGYPDNDDVLALSEATYRMSYSITDMPFTNAMATSMQEVYLYADELLSGNRTATVKVSFTYRGVTESKGFTITQSGAVTSNSYYIENFEETSHHINPGLDASFATQTTMAWGFGGTQLYSGADMYNGGMGGYLTANAVYSGVSSGAGNAPQWAVDNNRPLYSYNGSVITAYVASTPQPPYYSPVLSTLTDPSPTTYYHPIYNSSAARYCHEKNRDVNGDGVIDQSETGWYLPSFGDLWAMRTALGTNNRNYWSSTEENTTQGWIFNPTVAPSSSSLVTKSSDGYYVRCVRGGSQMVIGEATIASREADNTKMNFTYVATQAPFDVTDANGQGLQWTVTSSAPSWLTIKTTSAGAAGATSQTGVGSRTDASGYYVYANTNSGEMRSATIILTRAGQPQTPVRQITVNQGVEPGGSNDILYFAADGTLKCGKIDVDFVRTAMAFFQCGSVVGFTNNNDSWSASSTASGGSVRFNPVNPGAGYDYVFIPRYDNDVTAAIGVEGWISDTWHTGANVKLGKGDPCKLVGLTAAKVKSMTIAQIEAHRSGWRLPRSTQQAVFCGLRGGSSNYQNGSSAIGGLNQFPYYANSSGQYIYLQPSLSLDGARGYFPVGGGTLASENTGRTFNSNGLYLPAAGNRGTAGGTQYVGQHGYYWSGTVNSNTDAKSLRFYNSQLSPRNNNSYALGNGVRCVSQE